MCSESHTAAGSRATQLLPGRSPGVRNVEQMAATWATSSCWNCRPNESCNEYVYELLHAGLYRQGAGPCSSPCRGPAASALSPDGHGMSPAWEADKEPSRVILEDLKTVKTPFRQGQIQGAGCTPPLQLSPPQKKKSDTPSPFMLYGYTNYEFCVLPSLPRSLQQQERLLPGFQPAEVV